LNKIQYPLVHRYYQILMKLYSQTYLLTVDL